MERAFGVFVAVLATAAFGLGSVAAQEATPAASDPPPLPGQSAEAEREFRTSGARDGALAFRFGVGEFVDAASAAAALPAVVERIRAQPNLAALRPATAPAFGDEAHAFAGPVPSGETTLETVILIVRADRYLYLWIASGLASDPFPDLIAVAERVFARPAPADASPAPGDGTAPWLLGRLPTLNDLPAGFVMSKEASEVEAVATPVP